MSAKHIIAILAQPLILGLLLCVSPAFGEPLVGLMELRGTVGYSNFLDDGPLHHLVTGGSARFFVTNRIAVEPEFLFMYPGRGRTSTFISFQTWSSSSQSANRVFNRMQ